MPSDLIDRDRLRALTDREQAAFAERHPRSAAAYAGAGHLFGRVPMTWMNKTAGGFPVYVDRATPAPWPGTPPRRWWRP
jgi:glutamate-1-semialdehyde 2,1-aminomutase